jgi:hypothetical protein
MCGVDERLRRHVEHMWAAVEKDVDGDVERLKCWDYILADDTIAALVGHNDSARGREILDAMKSARALDIDTDGRIRYVEFQRLFHPAVMKVAVAKVDAMPIHG